MPRLPIFRELATARVTKAAGLRLLAQGKCQLAAPSVAAFRIDRPADRAAFVEANRKPHARIIDLAQWPPALAGGGPGEVLGARAMTGLAADVDLRKGRGEAIGRRVVVFAHAGRMTFRTHEIPILVELGPVQEVVVPDRLVGIKVKPALATRLLGAGVPGQRQGLQAAVRKFDQVLLQRVDAEGVLHLEGGKLAVGTVGFDQELAVVAKEA